MTQLKFLCALMCGLFTVEAAAMAGDWPMWRYDAGRGASSPEGLPRRMHLQWVRELPPAQPAWPANQTKLQFDVAPEPVVMGPRIFVPSTLTDSLTAYDTRNGKELWRFYADSPVRFAAVAYQGRVYFVSDDGHLYCLDAATGKLNWKRNGGPTQRWILGNRRLTSSWPARGAPVLHEGKIYFAASIWPFMGIFIHAVDPQTGDIVWTNSGDGTNFIKQPHGGAVSFATVVPQGHLAAEGDNLIIPGGRSTPAVYDARTGELKHFSFDRRKGGFVVTTRGGAYFVDDTAYNVENGRRLSAGSLAMIAGAPLLHDDKTLISMRGKDVQLSRIIGVKESVVIDRRGKATKVRKMETKALSRFSLDDGSWKTFIKAGDQIYAGGKNKVAAFDVVSSENKSARKPTWSAEIKGDVWNLVAADDRLFVVTTDSRIYCFGGDEPSDVIEHPLIKMQLGAGSDTYAAKADEILSREGTKEGYALALGVASGRLIEELLNQSKLFVIVVDADAGKVDAFRRKMQLIGLYGRRVSAHVGDPATFEFPPYIANLIVAENPAAAGVQQGAPFVRQIFSALRPYGGMACLELSPAEHAKFARDVKAANLKQPQLKRRGRLTWLVREGALPGSDDWTHQYGSAAQAVVSRDKLVKAPLGVLWFGGASHMGVLPRHSHGPSPQVAGGRLFIEGPDMLRAVDVYTGRVLWEKTLKDIGHYYKTTSHFPGAGEIGSNYVSLPDRVYAVYGSVILELDAATGKTLKKFELQKKPGEKAPDWGYLGVWEDLLVATSSPLDVGASPAKGDGAAKSNSTLPQTRYASGSRRLVVFNRHSGKRLWSRDAQFNFRHNNIAVAAGKVFCIDSLTEAKRRALARRGIKLEGKPVLYALDARSGKIVWSSDENVFGTFLNYSKEYDILLQAGSRYRDRARDETGAGMAAFRGKDGKLLWQSGMAYGGPCLLWRDQILTNGGGGFALNLQTGKPTGWKYRRAYGCNTAIGGEHLLTFRSGAAGICDLLNDSGTGNLGGFRSSCTANLIPAGGVLNAPDYTRTCSCAYQIQTSLALVHMPEAEFWTFGAKFRDGRIGVNFGAPGDRRAAGGALWVDFPSVGGSSDNPPIEVEPKQTRVFRFHSSSVVGELKWVAASGILGVQRVTIKIEGNKACRLKLHFLEPDEDRRDGERRFDVVLQDKTVLKDFDVRKEAGGARRGIVKQFSVTPAGGQIILQFKSKTEQPVILSGIEIVRN